VLVVDLGKYKLFKVYHYVIIPATPWPKLVHVLAQHSSNFELCILFHFNL
jgi:hypothetical protein